MYSIGKHVESNIGILFRGSYGYKFNHLVIPWPECPAPLWLSLNL
jgi:hypothetical protein